MGIASWPLARVSLQPGQALAAPCPVPGQTLPEYRLVRYLGEGAMGVVFEAKDSTHQDERLAVKFITPEMAADPRWVQEFLEEAQYGIRKTPSEYLAHTYQVLDLQAFGGWPPIGLVMRYYDLSLQTVLSRCDDHGWRLPMTWVSAWLQQLAAGLAALHRQGVVHRDLSPRNIMVQLRPDAAPAENLDSLEVLRDSSLVLADLGIACRKGTVPPIPAFSRKDPYKDPAFFPRDAGDPRQPVIEPAADIYALGKLCDTFLDRMEGPKTWLERVRDRCQSLPWQRRPSAAELIPALRWEDDANLARVESAGWRPALHDRLIGRDKVFRAFDAFADACDGAGHGGVFVVLGPSGIGKTALLTHWAGRSGRPRGFFFSYSEASLKQAESMPRQIYEQLSQEFGLNRPAPDDIKRYPGCLIDLLKEIIVAPSLPGQHRLLIVVDALDESSNAEQASQLLPHTGLPAGVFLIVSSRPSSLGQSRLTGLHSAQSFELRAGDPDNLQDVADFFRDRLGEDLAPEEATRLAEAAGGIFRLAVLMVDDLRRGTARDELLRQEWARLPAGDRIFGYYRQSWQRIQEEWKEDRTCVSEVAAVLAAAQDWLPEEELCSFLEWYDSRQTRRSQLWDLTRLNEIPHALTWLLQAEDQERDGGKAVRCLRVQHQSVRDFLTNPHDGPVRRGQKGIHAALGDFYRERAKPNWRTVERYGRFHAVRHLLEAGDPEHVEAAARLLTDLDYLQATLGDEPPNRPRSSGEPT